MIDFLGSIYLNPNQEDIGYFKEKRSLKNSWFSKWAQNGLVHSITFDRTNLESPNLVYRWILGSSHMGLHMAGIIFERDSETFSRQSFQMSHLNHANGTYCLIEISVLMHWLQSRSDVGLKACNTELQSLDVVERRSGRWLPSCSL